MAKRKNQQTAPSWKPIMTIEYAGKTFTACFDRRKKTIGFFVDDQLVDDPKLLEALRQEFQKRNEQI